MENRKNKGILINDMYATLFDRILQGEYPQDARLKEEILTKEFDVSRTSVRSTLRYLEQDSLIEILPNRGAKVFPFTADDIEEIFEIRKVLEVLALDLSIASLSINDLMEIRTTITEQQQSNDSKKHSETDEKFHKYFIDISRKRRLISMLHNLYRLIRRFREIGFRDKDITRIATKEHINIIDALCLRDAERAKELLILHLQNSKTRLISRLISAER